MRLSLANCLELVATLVVGMALSRFYYDMTEYNDQMLSTSKSIDLIGSFLAGISLAGGSGLGIESSRSRNREKAWGIGRWALSLSAMSIVLACIWMAIEAPLFVYRMEHRLITFDKFADIVFVSVPVNSLHSVPGFLIAFLMTSRLAHRPRDTAVDYREWSGRTLFTLLVVWEALSKIFIICQ
jgi:hypothetical protein